MKRYKALLKEDQWDDEDSDENEDFEEPEFNEPEEDDIFVEWDHRGGGSYAVGNSGKNIGSFKELDDAYDFIREWTKKNRYWPTVWFIDDHGGSTVVDDIYKKR